MASQEATALAFSRMAAAKFDDILNQIRGSSLNFQIKVSPFSAEIHLSKSITKDKFGNYLQQNVSVNRKNKDMDDLVSKNLALEEEIVTLRRSYLEASVSLAKIEGKLDELNRHRENENAPKMTSTPLTTKSKECISNNSVCDSGLDLRIPVSTPEVAKDHDLSLESSCKVCYRTFATEQEINHPCDEYDEENKYECASCAVCNEEAEMPSWHRPTWQEAAEHYNCIENVLSSKRISCDLCKEVFKNEGELITHKKQQHDPSLEYICEVCSRTFSTEQEILDQHDEEFKYGCFSCKICFISYCNYTLHIKKSHGKVEHMSKQDRKKVNGGTSKVNSRGNLSCEPHQV